MSYKSTHTGAQIDAGVSAALNPDATPTLSSTNLVTSGGVAAKLSEKQDTLVFDNAPTSGSNNPVKSGGIYTALAGKASNADLALKANMASLAPAFDSTATYAVGDLVLYDGAVYRFTTAHTGAWDAADVEQTTLGAELTEKADKTDMEAALALKADKTDVEANEASIEYLKLREEEDRQMILGSVAEVVEDSYSELRSAPIHTAITIGQSVYPRMDNTRLGVETIKGRTVVDNDALVPCVVSGVEVTGFNLFNKSVANAGVSISSDGTLVSDVAWATSGFIEVVPNTAYYFKDVASSSMRIAMAWYDSSKGFISINTIYDAGVIASGIKTSPNNAKYVRVTTPNAYVSACCVNISSSMNGTYKPYDASAFSTLSLPSTTLNGAGAAQDYIEAVEVGENDYSLIKHTLMGEVDLGTLEWNYVGSPLNRFYTTNPVLGAKPVPADNVVGNIICTKYLADTVVHTADSSYDKIIGISDSGKLYVKDSAYTDATTFTAALNGVYLVYELATPTETTIAEHLTLAEVSMLAENGGIIGILNSNGDIVQPNLTVDTVISKSAS